jgi:hypothetical protein
MLPSVDAVFTLVQRFACRQAVTDVAAPKWLVKRHGMGPLAARSGLSGFRDDLARATLAWANVARDLPGVVGDLRAAGVRVAPIKGVAYARTLYETPGERPMSDADLLVPLVDRDRAGRVLAELGFRAVGRSSVHHANAWSRGELMIDLHWNIIGRGRARIDLDAVWSRTSPGWPAGAEYLEPTDSLVFHLVHLLRNRLRAPLIHVVDAGRLLERASRTEALSRASAWGLGPGVALAMRFCLSILDGASGRPAGLLGPSRTELMVLSEQSAAGKALFDIATAGSPSQIAARVAHAGASFLARRGVRRVNESGDGRA